MFQYKAGGEGCGWYVDDARFFPTQIDKDGPTIWIALDGIQVSEGGGLAVVNRTKFNKISTISEDACRDAIKSNTCSMKNLSPECYNFMEQSKLEWDMKPGDAIIWNRWTFHRGVASREDIDPQDFERRRYSVRYMPYGSKAGFFVHESVVPGKPFDSPYYPQVWPILKQDEVKAIEHGLEADTKLLRTILLLTKRKMNNFLASLST